MLYIDRVKQLPPHVQQSILAEATNTKIVAPIPDEFKFLRGAHVDLGFRNLDINYEATIRAFMGEGVAIPNSNYQFRLLPTGYTVIESRKAHTILPANWKQGVLVVSRDNRPLWVGKLVKSEQLYGFEPVRFTTTSDGLVYN